MSGVDKARPLAGAGPRNLVGTGSVCISIVLSSDDTELDASPFFCACYAVLVRGNALRRHLYPSLAAAEREVKRARERGDRADMVLVKLVPVDARLLDSGGAA